MLDTVDAEPGHPLDAGVVCGVGGDGQAVPVGFVDDRVEFLVGELQRVVARHDLDEVCASSHLLPHRTAHLIRPRCFPAYPVGMAAGLDDGRTANLQARPGEHALLHRLFREQVHVVEAQVPHHSDAGPQALQHVAGSFEGGDGAGVVHGLAGQVVDSVPVEMGVAVDQPGHDGAPRLLYGRCRIAQVGALAHRSDLAVTNFDEAFVDHSGGTVGAVALPGRHGEDASGEDDILHRHVEHGFGDLVVAPGCRLGHGAPLGRVGGVPEPGEGGT